MWDSPSKTDALREMRSHMTSLVSWAVGLQVSLELVVLTHLCPRNKPCPPGSEKLRVPELGTIWRMDLEATLRFQSSSYFRGILVVLEAD